MLQSVPSLGNAKPRLLGTFIDLVYVVVQVLGPNTLYLSETDTGLMSSDDSGATIDALQIVSASGIVGFWWRGDLFAAGSQAANATFKPYIAFSTGIFSSSSPMGQGYGTSAYGIQPTQEVGS